jgi:hypothetical protein
LLRATPAAAKADESYATYSTYEPDSASPGYSRRQLLSAGTFLTALLSAGCPPPPEEVEAYTDEELDGEDKALDPILRRLVDRCTFGGTREERDLAAQLGYDGYLEYHLDYKSIDDSAVEAMLAPLTTLRMTARQIRHEAQMGEYHAIYELIGGTVLRSTYSKRQLYQRMVEFWTDHFNIYIDEDYQYYFKPVNDREVIRRHALATFPEILWASAHSPAMLTYLDNDPSSLEAPNQNFARELMELHTIGVDNFTQKDVIEVARCFTGWSFRHDYLSDYWGTFEFYSYIHDNGRKKVLGHTIRRNGYLGDGETVLRLLSVDPEISQFTARHLGRKLAIYFWGDNPPQALVNDAANAYLTTGGDIKAMVRAVLSENWLSQAPPKLKRPYHYAISTLRAVPSQVNEFWGIRYKLDLMGHQPFGWPAPNGYPASVGFWSGLLLPRWNFGATIYQQSGHIEFDLSEFEGDFTPEEFVRKIAKVFFGGRIPKADKRALIEYIEMNPYSNYRKLEALGLAVSMSGFQWY